MSKKLVDLAELFKIFGDENRLNILEFLSDGRKCVCEIHEPLKLPQNLVSHHLNILKRSGVLDSKKEGRSVYYSINEKSLGKLSKFLDSLSGDFETS